MRWLIRVVASVTVLTAAFLALRLGRPAPTPGPVDAPEDVLPRPSLVAAIPDDWVAAAKSHLERTGAPIRGKDLDALLRIVDRSATRFGIDPLTVLAVIQVESRFDPRAISPRGAMGLMQLRAETAREIAGELGVPWDSDDLLFEPELNVVIGTCYLSRLIEHFGDLDAALAAFHSGPSRIELQRLQGEGIPLGYADRVWDAILRIRLRTLA